MSKRKHSFIGILCTVIIIGFLNLSSTTLEVENAIPQLEVYIVDQEKLPPATGKKGSTYTASIFIVDNLKEQILGPYRGSSFPNSRQSKEDPEKPNTLKEGVHLFNNKYGHKGGTIRGLNLINKDEKRVTKAFSWSNIPSEIVYANVHTGCSDNGNYNSRGSQGCITIHPDDVVPFLTHFDFSKGTKGISEGIVFIYRNTLEKREAFINQLKNLYPDEL